MAAQTGSPLILLSVWVVAGVVSLFGGMINAEIGSKLPKTGGQYVYFRYMYGDFFAFLYGWAGFIVINTAAIAAIAFVFAQYAEYFIALPRLSIATEQSVQWVIPFVGKIYPLQFIGVKALAIVVIVLITAVNYASLKWGAGVQLFFTVIKVAALLLLAGLIFFSGQGSVENFTKPSIDADFSTWAVITGFVAATSGALAAYDGWNNLGFVAGEIKNPRRNIPRGLFIGIGICVLMYVLTNQAYVYMMPVDEMKHSSLVAADALNKAMGVAGGILIALLVMLSTFGAANGNILPCARVVFAMGEEKRFFSWTGKVHPRFHTPGNALWLQCAWACLFVLTGSFDMLTDMFVFITWIFYGFAAYGIFILRRKMPEAAGGESTYKAWGYPIVPIIFIAFAALYFVLTIYNDVMNYASGKAPVINSVLGLLLTVTGIPLYFYFKRKSKS